MPFDPKQLADPKHRKLLIIGGLSAAAVTFATTCLCCCGIGAWLFPASQPVNVKVPGKAAAPPTANARPSVPVVTNQQRQELITELNGTISTMDAGLKKLLQGEVELKSLREFQQPKSVEEITKRRELENKIKKDRTDYAKRLLDLKLIRELADTSPERQRELSQRIIDRYREKYLPKYERSFVVEKVGDRADAHAGQLAGEVSNKAVFGFNERYEVEWIVNDASAYIKDRIDEIVDILANQLK